MANIKISELNELLPGQKAYDDYLAIVDSSADETKKISVETLTSTGVKLIAVSSTEPTEFSNGDKYYNTTNNRIYEARTDVWYNPQEPVEGIFYIIFDSQNIYTYDKENETLISVGGGAGGGDSTPIGTVQEYAGSTAPDGYLMCDGSAVSRETYKDLYRVIGTTYGRGDGSTTFNLPNIKGRVVVMLDSSQTEFDALGDRGGEKTHTLTVNEMPSHNHGDINVGGDMNNNNLTAFQQEQGNKGIFNLNSLYQTTGSTQNHFVTGTNGGGQAHNILQPYIVLNKIIKVQKIAGEVLSEQLPVGTEVDFDGSASDIPIGWEQVESYSTSEVKTGDTWIDGKPIYRKVGTGTSVSGSAVTVSMGLTNFSTITRMYGIYNSYYPIPYATTTAGFTIEMYRTGQNINVVFGSSITDAPFYIIVEYTKTTD